MILSDAAHSFGATHHSVKTGMLTDVTVFSFHAVKNLTTAEGGAIAFNLPASFDGEKIYRELRIKTLHGQDKDALAKTKPGNWKCDIVEAGYKMNMPDLSASIGLVQLAKYDSIILKRRKEIIDAYIKFVSEMPWAILPQIKTTDRETSYHLFPLRIKGISEDQRDRIIEEIFKQEVSVNVHFIPVPMMTFYKSLGYSITDYPNTYAMYENEISLPVYTGLTDEQVGKVVDALLHAVNKVLNSSESKSIPNG